MFIHTSSELILFARFKKFVTLTNQKKKIDIRTHTCYKERSSENKNALFFLRTQPTFLRVCVFSLAIFNGSRINFGILLKPDITR